MKTISLIIGSLLFMGLSTSQTVYDFSLETLSGEEVSLSQFEGNVLLIVNTASECGYTPQYKELQELYEEYNDQGFYVLGFPANNFGGQEPGSDEEIAQFCEMNYGVTFPMFTKISVKGDDQHPLYNYLTQTDNPDFTGEIGWNFEKFLVDRNGNVVRRFKSNVTPMGEELTSAVKDII
ncbi:glutathione peroxidase [Rhodohalobacter barkolensis]|uniref:Glutathione peroxidase n=1 Tax=Rhodohalobacter barkolensis TaxID=2053187 RepID=A0A2N0VES4_9BACT|nr:glutathione peroxidase [Rhodohalobacter barkolensis]PKD42689.1 glutathione peroxidase [Rhodohalobacter barkolensis]